jgi:hypothetical protein
MSGSSFAQSPSGMRGNSVGTGWRSLLNRRLAAGRGARLGRPAPPSFEVPSSDSGWDIGLSGTAETLFGRTRYRPAGHALEHFEANVPRNL